VTSVRTASGQGCHRDAQALFASSARLDDVTLLEAVGEGNEAAMAVLYHRHGHHVFSLARRILGDSARAEDIVQDVFLRLWQQPEHYDPARGTLRSLLFRQAHHRAVERVRSDVARSNRENRYDRLNVPAEPDVEHEAMAKLRDRALHAALIDLADGERTAVILAYFDGLPYRRVAARLNLPEGTAKSRIRAALVHLEHRLSGTELDPLGTGLPTGA
jgi:RNA polymerase sigma-70 factor, ECF subfamily